MPTTSPGRAERPVLPWPDSPLHTRFDTSAGRDVPLGSPTRPTWRGGIHLIGIVLAVPAMTLMIIAADGARARTGVAIYAAGLCGMLIASTTYHRWVHALRARAAWRRADHAMIFAAIAGSTTPILLIVMPNGMGIALLSVVWSLAAAGAAMKLGHWHRGDIAGSLMYAAVSVLAALALPAMWVRGGVAPAVLMIVSGALYVLGAQWFSKDWPRIRPAVFSYHEVWHLFTIAAAATHFAAVWSIST